jgi:DnaJ-class molecular chaperone
MNTTATATKQTVAAKGETCERCGGNGQWVRWTGSKKHAGVCYRCGGKGHQTAADKARNLAYDVWAMGGYRD